MWGPLPHAVPFAYSRVRKRPRSFGPSGDFHFRGIRFSRVPLGHPGRSCQCGRAERRAFSLPGFPSAAPGPGGGPPLLTQAYTFWSPVLRARLPEPLRAPYLGHPGLGVCTLWPEGPSHESPGQRPGLRAPYLGHAGLGVCTLWPEGPSLRAPYLGHRGLGVCKLWPEGPSHESPGQRPGTRVSPYCAP